MTVNQQVLYILDKSRVTAPFLQGPIDTCLFHQRQAMDTDTPMTFSNAANQLLRSVASHPTEQGAWGQAVAVAKSTSGQTKEDAKAAKNKKEREKMKARKAGTAPVFLPKQQWLAI
jgi:hypothetical protein